MVNKISILAIILICLAGLVVAGDLLSRTITIGKERTDALKTIGIITPKLSDTICDDNYCVATLIQEVNRTELDDKGKPISVFDHTVLNTQVRIKHNVTMTDKDIEDAMTLAVKKRLTQIADAKINQKATSNKGGAGDIILQ